MSVGSAEDPTGSMAMGKRVSMDLRQSISRKKSTFIADDGTEKAVNEEELRAGELVDLNGIQQMRYTIRRTTTVGAATKQRRTTVIVGDPKHTVTWEGLKCLTHFPTYSLVSIVLGFAEFARYMRHCNRYATLQVRPRHFALYRDKHNGLGVDYEGTTCE